MGYKREFIQFLAGCGVLKFGEFTLKSGRKAPYFLNAGEYKTGEQIKKLGEFYADCIVQNEIAVDTLFGPAYKGIPLAISAAVALYEKYNINCNFCFDRKEVKDHGEGGLFVGKQLQDKEKIVIIEDVMTSGKALLEVLPKLQSSANVDVRGMIITVDRMEKALTSEKSAVQMAFDEHGVKVYPIITILDIIEALKDKSIAGIEYLPAIEKYLDEYGVNVKL